jgi:hypothetical protein
VTLVPPDFRPRCLKCGEKWLPPEGVDAQIMMCPSCRATRWDIPPELSIVSATGADLERLFELVRPRMLRETARDMVATASVIELLRQRLNPASGLVAEYMRILRSRKEQWNGVLLCAVNGRKCIAHPTGARCLFYCQAEPTITSRKVHG